MGKQTEPLLAFLDASPRYWVSQKRLPELRRLLKAVWPLLRMKRQIPPDVTGDEPIIAACHQRGGPILSVRLKRLGPVVDRKRCTTLDVSIDLHKLIVRRLSAQGYGTLSAEQGRKGNRVLTPKQVREIRQLYAKGRTASAIAGLFGVSRTTISSVVAGRTYVEV